MTLTCPSCGQLNPDGARVCQECGASLASSPCRYSNECDETYEPCGGHLSTFVAGGYPGEPAYYTFCDRCGAEYPHKDASTQCTRLVCNKCGRLMP